MSDHTVVKASIMWCGVACSKVLVMLGVSSWGDAAAVWATFSAIAAFVYSVLMIIEHFRKKDRRR